MNQQAIGKYIQQKRKEKNLTQEQLSEILNVSNKTISKWENGKCMPDYSIIKTLCDALSITLSELMDAEDQDKDSVRVYDEEEILDLLRRSQNLEKQNRVLFGLILVILGLLSNVMASTFSGTPFRDFASGLLIGLSVVEAIAGIFIAGKKLIEK